MAETWREVWRRAVGPLMPTRGLTALLVALEQDDQRLLQGATISPPPLQCVRDWPVEGACAIGFCGWQGAGLGTVEEVQEFFALKCFEIDQRLHEAAGCRWFLNWTDETPREEMRAALIPEVKAELERRAAPCN